jgi:hypothetical protein
MFTRAGPLAAVLAATLVLVPAATPGTYADEAGDSGSAGDITGIQVDSDKQSGQIIFRITGTNLSTSASVPTFLLIDSDSNPFTGDVGSVGADYVFSIDDESFWFEHWNGSDWVDTSYGTVRITGGINGLMISVNRSELGNTGELNFWARSYDRVNKKVDDAPDDGAFNYSIGANGPDIQSVDVQTVPASGPMHGRKFVVIPAALKLPPDGALNAALHAAEAPDSYSCKARLGQRAVPGTGKGGCAFAVPRKKSRGKQLTVAVTVNYQGASKAFTYAFRVR